MIEHVCRNLLEQYQSGHALAFTELPTNQHHVVLELLHDIAPRKQVSPAPAITLIRAARSWTGVSASARTTQCSSTDAASTSTGGPAWQAAASDAIEPARGAASAQCRPCRASGTARGRAGRPRHSANSRRATGTERGGSTDP